MESLCGEKFYLVEVVAFVLKHLKEVLIQRLTAQLGYDVHPADIQWAITVPTIWTYKEKQLMREAACLVCECMLICACIVDNV